VEALLDNSVLAVLGIGGGIIDGMFTTGDPVRCDGCPKEGAVDTVVVPDDVAGD